MFVGLRYIANVAAFSVLKSSVDINIIGSFMMLLYFQSLDFALE